LPLRCPALLADRESQVEHGGADPRSVDVRLPMCEVLTLNI
jgi:hypothetical protein